MSAFNILILICAVGCALVSGVFFAFSTSVMSALGKLPAGHGIAAMQAINIVIINPLFLGVFLGSAITCGIAIIACLLQRESSGSVWVLTGSLLYLIGSFLVTMRFNVPRNDVLARLSASAPESIGVWKEYVVTWTAWNHVRMVASLAAAVSFMLAAFSR